MSKPVRAHVIISGRVQGVFFRMETQKAAQRIGGIAGWVRNRQDGTVEAVYEGDEQKVAEMLEWSKQGSPQARVDRVDVEWESPAGDLNAFEINH